MNKVHVVSEIGVNYDSLTTAKAMIREASKSGCDYAKFQLFNKDVIKDSPIREKLEPLILNEGNVKDLVQFAKKHEIGIIFTPMYLDAVDIAAKYGDYIKIRYADHKNEELIEKAEATGKTLLISVPYRPLNVYSPRKKYLFCLPMYPPRIEDFNLEVACSCHGLSSHFPHTVCDLAYVINRSFEECFIEKHVMAGLLTKWVKDERLSEFPIPVEYEPLDKAVSVTFQQLKDFVEQVKLVEQMKRIRL